jgi:glycosyltransferase involved in cell wall biosynthesis
MTVTGFVPEEYIGPLTAGAEVALFPSLYEGFGLPVIEAMAAGTPVITGNATALPEVAGDAAVQIDVSRPAAIADAIVAVSGDGALRGDLRERGLARSRRFSWDAAALSYRKIFDSLR